MRTSLTIVAYIATSCGETQKDTDNDVTNQADELPHGIILDNMDASVNPKDDFYNYVNGNWMKNTEIPDDQTRWGGFGVLLKKTDYDMLAILDKAKKSNKYADDTDQAKALMIFESELDVAARNKAGVKPLMPALMLMIYLISYATHCALLGRVNSRVRSRDTRRA